MQEKKRRTPREKKQLEYRKDFVNYAEYPQTFHKAWARKEARTHRAYRRKIHQLNSSLSTRDESDFPDWAEPGVVRLEQVEKWPVRPMGEVVEHRIQNRLRRMAWNFYKKPYDSRRDRERFTLFLSSLISGHSTKSEIAALLFKMPLDIVSFTDRKRLEVLGYKVPIWPVSVEQESTWLQAFFKDEPEWEGRLRAWIASFQLDLDSLLADVTPDNIHPEIFTGPPVGKEIPYALPASTNRSSASCSPSDVIDNS